MNELLKTTLVGLFFGTFGTMIGGIIGVSFKETSNRFLSLILSLASGLMLSIVCFDLIPESMEISNVTGTIWGVLLGAFCMMFCDALVQRKNRHDGINRNRLLKTGIIVSIGLALHNFPEGLAIGSSFDASIKLGYALALAICIHDIPERYFYGSTTEKWGNESGKSSFLCVYVRCYNRPGSVLWSVSGWNL